MTPAGSRCPEGGTGKHTVHRGGHRARAGLAAELSGQPRVLPVPAVEQVAVVLEHEPPAEGSSSDSRVRSRGAPVGGLNRQVPPETTVRRLTGAGRNDDIGNIVAATITRVYRIAGTLHAPPHFRLSNPATRSQVNSLAISPDKQFIAAAGNPHTRLYDTNSADTSPLRSFDGHVNNVNAVGFQRDSRWMYTGSDDGTLKIWDLRAPGNAREFGTCQREYDNGGSITTVVLHPNQGELIAGDENGNIRVFDLTQNKMSYEQHSGVGSAVRSLSIAADASLAATSHDNGKVVLWKLPNGRQTISQLEEQVVFQAHKTYVSSHPAYHEFPFEQGRVSKPGAVQALKCRLSPDMSCLATASADSTVRLWSVRSLVNDPTESGSQKAEVDDTLQDSDPTPHILAANPSTCRPDVIQPIKSLCGHQRWVWDCVFSADSAYLVSASSDATARLWDLSTAESIREYQGHSKAVTVVALSDQERQT